MDYKKELEDKSIEMRNEIMVLEENTYSKYVLLEDAIAIANRFNALVRQGKYYESRIKDLKLVRNYFGEHDRTTFEHFAYAVVDKLIKEIETKDKTEADVLLAGITEAFPIKATHIKLGEIDIYGVRIKSNYSKNTMYQIFLRGSEVWVYDYETKLSK